MNPPNGYPENTKFTLPGCHGCKELAVRVRELEAERDQLRQSLKTTRAVNRKLSLAVDELTDIHG